MLADKQRFIELLESINGLIDLTESEILTMRTNPEFCYEVLQENFGSNKAEKVTEYLFEAFFANKKRQEKWEQDGIFGKFKDIRGIYDRIKNSAGDKLAEDKNLNPTKKALKKIRNMYWDSPFDEDELEYYRLVRDEFEPNKPISTILNQIGRYYTPKKLEEERERRKREDERVNKYNNTFFNKIRNRKIEPDYDREIRANPIQCEPLVSDPNTEPEKYSQEQEQQKNKYKQQRKDWVKSKLQ